MLCVYTWEREGFSQRFLLGMYEDDEDDERWWLVLEPMSEESDADQLITIAWKGGATIATPLIGYLKQDGVTPSKPPGEALHQFVEGEVIIPPQGCFDPQSSSSG
jgi:hypothetical protein